MLMAFCNVILLLSTLHGLQERGDFEGLPSIRDQIIKRSKKNTGNKEAGLYRRFIIN